jgi:hypothetical protein
VRQDIHFKKRLLFSAADRLAILLKQVGHSRERCSKDINPFCLS